TGRPARAARLQGTPFAAPENDAREGVPVQSISWASNYPATARRFGVRRFIGALVFFVLLPDSARHHAPRAWTRRNDTKKRYQSADKSAHSKTLSTRHIVPSFCSARVMRARLCSLPRMASAS